MMQSKVAYSAGVGARFRRQFWDLWISFIGLPRVPAPSRVGLGVSYKQLDLRYLPTYLFLETAFNSLTYLPTFPCNRLGEHGKEPPAHRGSICERCGALELHSLLRGYLRADGPVLLLHVRFRDLLGGR